MANEQQVALITGGGTGIGRETALKLAARGVDVAVNYSRSQADADKTVREIKNIGRRAMAVRADVSDDGSVRAMIEAVLSEFGRLDILVNNAGQTTFVPLHDLEALQDSHWDQAFSVNVKGAFYCARAAAPSLRAAKGVVVNIASIAGMTGRGSSIAYAASKAAMISLTKSLAFVLAPDVRVNAVAPGFVDSRWTEGQSDYRASALAGTPLGRLPGPEDPADVAVALALDFRHVTGQAIVVDGGATL